MIIDILTIFPGMVAGPINESIIGKALERKLIEIRVINIRDYAADPHRTTDDRPFGGGSGMVMKPEPLVAAIGDVRKDYPASRVILLSPQAALRVRASRSTGWAKMCGSLTWSTPIKLRSNSWPTATPVSATARPAT